MVHDGTEYSYTVNAIGEWFSSQGGAAVLLPDGRRLPTEGETDQFDGWEEAMQANAKKIIRLREAEVTVPGGPFTELNFESVGGGGVEIVSTSSGTATVTISGGGGEVNAHDFAGPEHSVDTLANVNSKISDATLIDTGDSRLSDARTPTAHSLDSHNASTLAALNVIVSDATLIDTADQRLSNHRTANAIATTGSDVTISGSAPPSTGQILKATSPTTATWQADAGGFTMDVLDEGSSLVTDPTSIDFVGTGVIATASGSGVRVQIDGGTAAAADALSTTGADVDVSASDAPTVGQVLVATSATAATWQDVAAGGGGSPGTSTASGIDTIRIGSNASHDSQTPLLVGQFELDPTNYHAASTFILRAVAANGSSPLTTHLRLYNLTDNEQVQVLNFVDTLTPEVQSLEISAGTTSGTLRTTSTLYEAQMFVDSPVSASDTIELGSAELRVKFPVLSSGIDTIRFDTPRSYSSSTPLLVGQFELNTDDYPSTVQFTLRGIAGNGTSPLTTHIQLYNLTNGEVVSTLDFVDTTNTILKQNNLTKGTVSGTLRASSVIYEARIYVDSPATGADTIEFESAEIRVHY